MGRHSCWRLSSSGSQQFRQPRQIACRHCQREAGAHTLDAAIHGLGHPTDGLGPAERFLDLLPASLGFGGKRRLAPTLLLMASAAR